MSPKPATSARLLDQFYTQRAIVPALIKSVSKQLSKRPAASQGTVRWLEPSAGDGAFLDSMPAGSMGLDLAPGRPDVTPGNFLEWSPPQSPTPVTWVVVGNPPFGKNSSLAIKFFNRAAQFADIIAFIVPRTFEKVSVQNRLSADFALTVEKAIDPESFVFEGQPVAIPCVFQIWERLPKGQTRSSVRLPTSHADFIRVTDSKTADFALQRVGVHAGKIKDMTHKAISPPSHHFIRVTDRAQVAAVRAKLESIDWSAVKHRTAGNPSISLTEIVALYSAAP